MLFWEEAGDLSRPPGCCGNAHECVYTYTAHSQDSGPEGLRRGGHPGLLVLGARKPPERRASVPANQKVGSFLLGFQLASLPRASFPIQILPIDLLFIVACCPTAPLGHLARSCSCRDCTGRVVVWAGLGDETHCPQHTSKHPAPGFYLRGNWGPEKGFVSANSETCKKSTINIKPGLEGSYSDD